MRTYHDRPLAELYDEFTSSHKGMTTAKAQARLAEHGPNEISEKKRTPYLIQFLRQFYNFFSILLLCGAALSFLGEYISPGEGNIYIAFALLGVTLLNAVFSFFQDYRAQQAMKSFRNMLPQKMTVQRDGKQETIYARNLVPGDVIILREGDKIPADCRLIEEHLLKVDHSMLTGESEPQLRSEEKTSERELLSRNMVFSGTLVQSGSGKALVVRTGDDTEMGRIAKLTNTVEKEPSQIKGEIDHFVKIISGIAIVLGVVFFFLGLAVGTSFWGALVFAIGIIVANVPEGLLPTVTLTLSLAGQRMARHKAWVKDIESIETLGSVSTICTDKTGTLTENRLKVVTFFFEGKQYELDAQHEEFVNYETKSYLHHIQNNYYDRMLSCMYLCNNAEGDRGDPTEIALKESVEQHKNAETYQQAKREYELPFDSEKKYMITAHQTIHHRIAYMKGAPEAVMKKCTHLIKDGVQKEFTDHLRDEMQAENQHMAEKGFRILALGYKALGSRAATQDFIDQDDYVLLGFVALQDPPRKEVKHAVEQCYQAGIRIIVLSGDQAPTVAAISRQVGILKDHDQGKVLLSEDLAGMTDEDLRELLGKDRSPLIFARSMPADKLRIVRILQELNEVVAVTGDGVNDAPALRQANVGVAMGIAGTDVAKETANVVLLDDNFATIQKAVKSGRTVYENIKKFIIYILTSNIPEILPFLFFVLLGWPLALPVLLILAIDLGTDMIPAISLGKEASEGDVMKQKPRDKKAPLLTKRMLARSYGMAGPIQAAFAFLFFFHVLFAGGWSWGETPEPMLYAMAVAAYFASIIFSQVFDQLSARTLRKSAFRAPIKGNYLIFVGLAVEMILLAFIMFWLPAQILFGTAPFSLQLIPWMILAGSSILWIEELRKWYARKTGRLAVY